jgi:hypothetical protein
MPDPAAFEGPIELGQAHNLNAPSHVGLLVARFVRYPGCQQLQLWLPQPGYEGYGELRVVCDDGTVLDRDPLQRRLDGSVHLLFDTLDWPPCAITLEIDHSDGWQHRLPMHKLDEAAAKAAEAAAAAARQAADARLLNARHASRHRRADRPQRYRDGVGLWLPDESQILRERALAELTARLWRRVDHVGTVYGGQFIYSDGTVQIRFQQEMGTGGCKVLVHVPTVEHWVAATGAPLELRDEIVHCVAEAAQRLAGSRSVVGEDVIEIY